MKKKKKISNIKLLFLAKLFYKKGKIIETTLPQANLEPVFDHFKML